MTEEIPTIVPPGFVQAIRPLPAPMSFPNSSPSALVELSPSVDRSKEWEVQPQKPPDAGVPESFTLEAIDMSKVEYSFVRHLSVAIAVPGNVLPEVTGGIEPKVEDPASRVLVENRSESKLLLLNMLVFLWALKFSTGDYGEGASTLNSFGTVIHPQGTPLSVTRWYNQ